MKPVVLQRAAAALNQSEVRDRRLAGVPKCPLPVAVTHKPLLCCSKTNSLADESGGAVCYSRSTSNTFRGI